MCITWVPIKFWVLVIIINKKVYLHNDNKKKNYSVNPNQTWTRDKDFIEAGKVRLDSDTVRKATSDEVKELCQENTRKDKTKFH